MDNDRWNHVDQLLQSALDIPAVERDAYLRHACGGDKRLAEEVRSLLAAHDRADRFLGAPAIVLAARELSGERHLCMAGGVALNGLANGYILDRGVFDSIFVQPASADDGIALGAAGSVPGPEPVVFS